MNYPELRVANSRRTTVAADRTVHQATVALDIVLSEPDAGARRDQYFAAEVAMSTELVTA